MRPVGLPPGFDPQAGDMSEAVRQMAALHMHGQVGLPFFSALAVVRWSKVQRVADAQIWEWTIQAVFGEAWSLGRPFRVELLAISCLGPSCRRSTRSKGNTAITRTRGQDVVAEGNSGQICVVYGNFVHCDCLWME